jgi:SanA protein
MTIVLLTESSESIPPSPPRRPRWRLPRLWLLIGLFLAVTCGLGLVLVILVDRRMQRSTDGQIYRTIENVPQRDVALVLGAKVYPNGRLSAMLEDRVVSAAELYKAGKVRKLIMSGDNSERTYDEVTAMRQRAIVLGVKSDDVVRDFAGFRTYDSIYRARDLWDVQSALIVTQKFHLPRSIYIARGLGVDAIGFVADRRRYHTASIQRARTREVLARFAAWLDVNVFHPTPHFLGPKESLSGDTQEASVNNPTFPG